MEVTNLDRWMVRFLRGKRYEFHIEFGRNREAWQRALDLKPPELDLSDSFYEDEWEQVIQAKGVVSEQEYRRVSRVGRGTRLGRGARVRVWPVFEEYRAQLAERGLKEVDDAYRDAAALLGEDGAGSGYAAVVVDEAQDMGAQAFSLIRAIAPTRNATTSSSPAMATSGSMAVTGWSWGAAVSTSAAGPASCVSTTALLKRPAGGRQICYAGQ